MPIECRGVVAQYDAAADAMTVWSATQVVHWVRREVAATLGMPEASVRCVALDVGGGFGVKGHVYPEDLLIPFLARRLSRPIKWIEDRHEHLMCSCHSRDQIHDAEIGFDGEGRILAFRDRFLVDCGAFLLDIIERLLVRLLVFLDQADRGDDRGQRAEEDVRPAKEAAPKAAAKEGAAEKK